MTMAQAPESARFDAMPQNVIARGVVDHVLPISRMPATLLAYVQHETTRPSRIASTAPSEQSADTLRTVCAILRSATGHDFSHYKPGTLLRRIARRMQVGRVDGLAAYIERLRQEFAQWPIQKGNREAPVRGQDPVGEGFVEATVVGPFQQSLTKPFVSAYEAIAVVGDGFPGHCGFAPW